MRIVLSILISALFLVTATRQAAAQQQASAQKRSKQQDYLRARGACLEGNRIFREVGRCITE